MKLTTILLVGATLAAPAFAAGNSMSTQSQAAMSSTAMQPATNADTSVNTASNGKMAMNDGSADTSPLAAVPDTQKTYKRANRAADFDKEAETTRQLNQKVAAGGGLPKMPQ